MSVSFNFYQQDQIFELVKLTGKFSFYIFKTRLHSTFQFIDALIFTEVALQDVPVSIFAGQSLKLLVWFALKSSKAILM